ncbi:hypothetical protein QBC43DRAFT_1134 [Cladorrhinum sp. PSN259]|nr:hypothetical protein QBC43DRAFT_1134 [Cladorrhinum sp. PSN259]
MSSHHEKAPKRHTPHHVVPKHESGYTDEAAEECHDLIDRAEEEAHLHDPGSMYSTESSGMPSSSSKTSEMASKTKKKSGLEGSSMTDKPSGMSGMKGTTSGSMPSEGMGSKMESMGKSMKESMGSMKDSMKDSMGMKK